MTAQGIDVGDRICDNEAVAAVTCFGNQPALGKEGFVGWLIRVKVGDQWPVQRAESVCNDQDAMVPVFRHRERELSPVNFPGGEGRRCGSAAWRKYTQRQQRDKNSDPDVAAHSRRFRAFVTVSNCVRVIG